MTSVGKYLELLDSVTFKAKLNEPGSQVEQELVTALLADRPAADAQAFFGALNRTNIPVPRDLEGFIKLWHDGIPGVVGPANFNLSDPFATANGSELAKKLVEILVTDSLDAENDWTLLAFSGISQPPTNADQIELFKRVFSYFLNQYPYEPNGDATSGGVPQLNFIQKWLSFTNPITRLAEGNLLPGDTASTGIESIEYEQIYASILGTTDGYQQLLHNFYQEKLLETSRNKDAANPDGFFLPSLFVDSWVKKVKALALPREIDQYAEDVKQKAQALAAASAALAADPGNTTLQAAYDTARAEYIYLTTEGAYVFTSLESAEFDRVLVLDRIFRLIVLLIEVLQGVAASQANRLFFLTQWQKQYTDMLAGIRPFTSATQGSFSSVNFIEPTSQNLGISFNDNASALPNTIFALAGTTTEGIETSNRQELNAWNSAIIDQIRSRRSIVSDDAKALQSNVNQSNEAVSQQTNIATGILQQFSTILSAIFR